MEKVLVVERDKLLGGNLLLYGFHNQNLDELLKNIYRFGYFVDRPDAENNPSLKQIIPYLLISYKNNTANKHKLFLVQRLATQTEKRLHNKYSIGIGGHINPVRDRSPLGDRDSGINANYTLAKEHISKPSNESKNISNGVNPVSEQSGSLPVNDIIKSGLERELHEELEVSTPYQYKLIGYLNDDTNSVGQVHFGLVFQVMVNDENGVEVAEKDLMAGKFVNIKEIEKHFSLLESWSQIVYKDFVKLLND